jgi:hypothetical protein
LFDTSGVTAFGGVFAGNPALSLVQIVRVRVRVINPCFYLYLQLSTVIELITYIYYPPACLFVCLFDSIRLFTVTV